MKKTYLEYPSERDVVFILGAGASYPDNVPLQKQLLPLILDPEIGLKKTQIGKSVIEFITDNFSVNREENLYPKLELVFGFLDYFILQNESLNKKYTSTYLRDLREYLIMLIHYVVNVKSDTKSKVYHLFWDVINKFNKNVSVISFNYDTLLEQAFDKIYQKGAYIDYCIHFMNYEAREELRNFNFWIDPKRGVPFETGKELTAYKIIKLHGSLNWKYCNCCNQVLLTPWDKEIDLNSGKFWGYTYPENEKYHYICPQDGTEFETLIMPPSYTKHLNHPIISQLFAESARELRNAKKIVFVGYSLSDPDVHIRALVKKHITHDAEIIVINPKKSDTLKLKYKSLSDNVNFLDIPFEEFVRSEETVEKLLTK